MFQRSLRLSRSAGATETETTEKKPTLLNFRADEALNPGGDQNNMALQRRKRPVVGEMEKYNKVNRYETPYPNAKASSGSEPSVRHKATGIPHDIWPPAQAVR